MPDFNEIYEIKFAKFYEEVIKGFFKDDDEYMTYLKFKRFMSIYDFEKRHSDIIFRECLEEHNKEQN